LPPSHFTFHWHSTIPAGGGSGYPGDLTVPEGPFSLPQFGGGAGVGGGVGSVGVVGGLVVVVGGWVGVVGGLVVVVGVGVTTVGVGVPAVGVVSVQRIPRPCPAAGLESVFQS